MYRTVYWPCGITTDVSGDISRLEPSRQRHEMDSPLPISLLNQVCDCARINATFSENSDGSNKLTLVNDGSSDIWQRLKLNVIESIIERAVFRKSRTEIEEATTKKNLQRVIKWTIYDFSGEGPGEQLCLFIYSRRNLTSLPLSSLERIGTDEYYSIMQKFRNLLK
jgi:hypothetical protein